MSFTLSDLICLIVVFILILFVGFFTSSETAYISLSKIKLRRMQEEGKKKAKVVANERPMPETSIASISSRFTVPLW